GVCEETSSLLGNVITLQWPRLRRNNVGLVEELEEIEIDPDIPTRKLKIGKGLLLEVKSKSIKFLRANLDVFAWSHADMVGIDHPIISHVLNIDPNFWLVQQKRRLLDKERALALKE
uniref:Uncharacterized protein n=1 Tax=Cannabis sativa TaxID=3483 RepID=A0A803PCQ9_CANSA